MKTLVSKIVVIVALMCATSMNAQNNNQFDAQLKTTLSNVKADEATSIGNYSAVLISLYFLL